MNPLHKPEDQDHLVEIIQSIEANGWIGAPLVIFGDQLITGSHRYAACQALDWSDGEIPTVALEDIFAYCGLDFETLSAEEGNPDPITDMIDFTALLAYLPSAVRAEYGIDYNA